MKLDCYATGAVACPIVPAPQDRAWMDASPERYPYRCLPLNIANAFGWHVLAPCAIDIEYNGGPDKADIRVSSPESGAGVGHVCQSHFHRGLLTFHPGYLFRTDPGWNLLVSGPFNWPKDGIQPLTGIVETDWLPFPFTMNWQLTRPGQVRFERGEPFCQIVPVPAGGLDRVTPTIRALDDEPELAAEYAAYRDRRTEFLENLARQEPEAVREGWQKFYFRGRLPTGTRAPTSHASKLRLADPVDRRAPAAPAPEPAPVVPAPVVPAAAGLVRVPPGLSRQPVPVSRRRHAGLGIGRSDYRFAADHHLLPLGAAEFEPASQRYPLCFTRDPRGAVAVVGARPGENLFVENGTWADGGYLPGVVRQYPFSVEPDPAGRQWLLSIDEACPWLDPAAPAKLIEGGGLSEAGKAGATVAQALVHQQIALAEFVGQLLDHRLLVPASANQDHPIANRPAFASLLVVDHVRYGALPSSTAEEWRRAGWSQLVAAHVRSLGNWRRLAMLEAARRKTGVPA